MSFVHRLCKKVFGKTFIWKRLKQIKFLIKVRFNKIAYSMEMELPLRLGKNNPNKIFYLIGYYQTEWFVEQGVISTWLDFMPQVLYALSKGYVPIIDMLNNYKPMMLDEKNRGRINAWDLYFSQPQNDYTLEEALNSEKVIFGKDQTNISLSDDIKWSNIPLADTDFNICQEMLKYGNLSKTIVQNGDSFIRKNFPSGKKILGISFRREFEQLHYFNSWITPPGTHIVRTTLSELVETIKKVLKEIKYDKFFFIADDREAYDVVKRLFGDKCLYSERPVRHSFMDNKPIPLDRKDLIYVEYDKRDDDCMLREMEYMTDVYILSKCDSLLSAGGSADLFAYLLNNKKYENVIQLRDK